MDEIDLYYQIRDLFNTSSRAFDIFYQTKGRICKNTDNTFPINILILFPTRECLERTKRKFIAKTNVQRWNENTLYDLEKQYTFATIADIENNKINGQRFSSIRFLG